MEHIDLDLDHVLLFTVLSLLGILQTFSSNTPYFHAIRLHFSAS